MKKYITGAGGGGGKGGGSVHTPKEAPNTLSTNAVVTLVDLLGEGEIEGLVNGAQSVYFDDTPLQNADGSYNFEGVTLKSNHGTPAQDYLPGFAESASEEGFNVKVTHEQPVIRTVGRQETNELRVKIGLDALSEYASNGDINGSSVHIRLYLNNVLVVNHEITGKTTSKFEQTFIIKVSPGYYIADIENSDIVLDNLDEYFTWKRAGAHAITNNYYKPTHFTYPYTLKVERITEDADSSRVQNTIYLTSITDVIDTKLSYPNSAVVGLEFNAAQFGNQLPKRSYLVRGLKIQVPSNYNPSTRLYSGLWDGSFKTEYSNNPAWVFYDLLTNERYGAGNYLAEADLDKWELYSIAQYCDELVPDGRGGSQPRFCCNLAINNQNQALTIITQLTSIFRGMAYDAAGTIQFSQDRPREPSMLITQTDVVNGQFDYQTSSIKELHSVCVVAFRNPDLNYAIDQEVVEDASRLARLGERRLEITAVGCTSRSQAMRQGLWALQSEAQSEMISYKATQDHIHSLPSDIVKIFDPSMNQEEGAAGVIIAIDGNLITLDREVSLATQNTLMVFSTAQGIEEYTVMGAPGSRRLEVDRTIIADVGARWVLYHFTAPKQWRITAITEDDDGTYTVNAIAHDPDKYQKIDEERALGVSKENTAIPSLKAPSNYRVEQSLSYHGGIAEALLIVAFDGDSNAAFYEYHLRKNNGNYTDAKTTPLNHIELTSDGASYTFRVRAVGWFGQKSHYSTFSCTSSLEQHIPADVSRFVSSYSDKIAVLEWAKNPELYVKHYEIRHGTAWENSILIAELDSTTLHLTHARPGFYLIKAVSQWGIKSTQATVLELTDLTPLNIVQEYDYAANDWPGEFYQTAVNDNNHIRLFSFYSWGGMSEPWEDYNDAWDNIKSGTLSTDISEGYYLSSVYDLGSVMRCRVYADMQISQSNDDLSWDNMQQSWDHYTLDHNWSWLGSPEACGFEVQFSISSDNLTWSEFAPLSASFSHFHYARFKVILKRFDPQYTPELRQLICTFDVPEMIYNVDNFPVASIGSTYIFPEAMQQKVIVIATIQSGAAGDQVQVYKDLSQATIHIFDKNGSAKSGEVDLYIGGH
ncbi:host specificity protein J [Piscirickettsia salmonis]|uniref:host specificity protein J n=1 Tax=Piscirickettsia salmonis TaxID=1238 RepID=UPI003EB82CF6